MATIFVILFVVVSFVSVASLALFQNAKDADEAWEEAIKNKQNKDIK